MTNMTLDQGKKRFIEWRSQRPHREPIPEELWQIACSLIPSIGMTRVAREFRLNATTLRDRALQSGIVPSRVGKQEITQLKKVDFQEISMDRMLMAAVSGINLVLERPDGMRIRIEGQLPEPEYVNKLAVCFLR
jgi:hypothetical protein